MNKRDIEEIKQYQQYVEDISPKTNLMWGCVKAFVIGGLICVFGQFLKDIVGMQWLALSEKHAGVLCTVTLVGLAIILTGIGVFDNIGKFAGAGSAIPITGFANSMAAPAMEFRQEGLVMGIGAKMFIMAGPVLVYGISSSMVIGLIYWIIGG